MNSTIGQVCFTCHFVYSSQAQGCYIEYKCLRTDFNGNVTIERASNTNTASKCVTGIYTSNYNVTFYDVDRNYNINLEEYAIKLTDQFVIGLFLIPTSTSPSVPLSTNVISMSLLPTTLYTNSDNSKFIINIIII